MGSLGTSLPISRFEKTLSVFSGSIKQLREGYSDRLADLRSTTGALEKVSDQLRQSEKNNQQLTGQLESLVELQRGLKGEYAKALVNLKDSERAVEKISSDNQQLIGKLKLVIKSHRKGVSILRSYKEKHASLETALDKINQELGEERSKAICALESHRQKRAELKVSLDEANNSLDVAGQELLGEKGRMIDLESRYSLICNATSPIRNESDRYKNFRKLLDDSFLPFINRVNVVKNEAEQVMKIRAVDDELRLADSLAGFSERTIVAVAGGFSSGKSSLITSLFLDKNVSLPIGIEPVTAIPTYVFHSDKATIRGYPKSGGYFHIPDSLYARLSHQFVEEFGFNLRDLLPFMSLGVPMGSCRNLAFIDLPGYNPGDRGGDTSGDKSVSDEFITQGQALIWVIGLDSNGTVPADDLDHLWELSELGIPIYVVLNKADLRPAETLDEVLDQVVNELSDNSVSYEGISAYSSECGGEIKFRDSSLWEVLEKWDRPRDKLRTVAKRLLDIFEVYEVAIEDDIKQRRKKAAVLKSLELNLLEVGAFEDKQASSFDLNKYIDSDQDDLDSLTEENRDPELINLIQDQIQDLRLDFCEKQAMKDLAELCSIRSKVEQNMVPQRVVLHSSVELETSVNS